MSIAPTTNTNDKEKKSRGLVTSGVECGDGGVGGNRPVTIPERSIGGSLTRIRAVYGALVAITIALGLTVHRGPWIGNPIARDVTGDALWAMMMVWCVSVMAPTPRVFIRISIAYLICVLVEGSQLLSAPTLDAVRATGFGRLVLGSGFDPRDLVAYAVGVLAAWVLEAGLARSGVAVATHPTAD